MELQDLRKSDVASGLLLTAVGIAAAIGGLRMPRDADLSARVDLLTFPGALPMLLGTILALGGLVIAWNGWRGGGLPRGEDFWRMWRSLGSPAGVRAQVVVGAFAVYVVVLMVGVLSFWVVTFVYLSVLMILLQAGRLWLMLGVAIVVSVGLHLLFGMVMHLPMP